MPLPPEFFTGLPEMSDEQLIEMLAIGDAHYSEPVQAARTELRRRGKSDGQITTLETEARRTTAARIPKDIQKIRFLGEIIETPDQALRSIKGACYFFGCLAAISGIVGFFMENRLALVGAIVVVVLTGVVFARASRTAAILLALIGTSFRWQPRIVGDSLPNDPKSYSLRGVFSGRGRSARQILP